MEPGAKKVKISEEEYIIKQSQLTNRKHTKKYESEQTCYLHKLKIDSLEPLEKIKERTACPSCKKGRKFFCPKCYICFADPKLIPKVVLPIHVSVLQHPKEKPERSSIIPIKFISHDTFDIYRGEELPKINMDPKNTVLLYPRENALSLAEYGKEALSKITHLVMIDSTWEQVNTYLKQPEIQALQAIKISAEETTFWRYQRVDSSNLATVEALYFFFKEYDQCITNKEYDGKYDNLLYFYTFNYNLIQNAYKKEKKEVSYTNKISLYSFEESLII